MARLSEARHFYLKSMKRTLVLLLISLAIFSCKTRNTFRTYEMAEQEFRSSLTAQDTLAVLALGANFMDAIKNGNIEVELQDLCVLYRDTLYKVSDESLNLLRDRFTGVPITDYSLASMSFSTPGNNDLSYRYVMSGTVGSGPAFKLMFNPVKVGGNWYLTLKDGSMSSLDKSPNAQVHPHSPAPNPVVLHSK